MYFANGTFNEALYSLDTYLSSMLICVFSTPLFQRYFHSWFIHSLWKSHKTKPKNTCTLFNDVLGNT